MAAVDPAEQYTLLVVDDNEMNRDMLSRRLARRGFSVLVADDGGPAIEIVERQRVDLVLLDIMMPEVDGIQVLRRIRELYSESEVPVIMATAKAESENVVQALELGANDYVTKPLDFSVVLARVQAQLRARDGRRPAKPRPPETQATTEVGPGTVLAGKYEIVEAIGRGNFGAVYRARHVDLGSEVAVKVLRPNLAHADEAMARFRREGQSACRLRHPNAVTVHDFGVTEAGVAYLVMELLEGRSLGGELKRQGGRLPPARALPIAKAICDALAVAHAAGVVHRDVKPENVFLHEIETGHDGGEDVVVKVLDFGIAKVVGETVSSENLTTDGAVLGTPSYMAPDRINNLTIDGRADVYSVGVVLFEMLTGRLPFPADGKDPMLLIMQHVRDAPPRLDEVLPDVDPELADLVARTLAKRPEERPDAAALARALAHFASHPAAGSALDDTLPSGAGAVVDPRSAAESAAFDTAPTVSIRRPPPPRGWMARVVGTLRELFTVEP